MLRALCILYAVVIYYPLFALVTILTAIVSAVGCTIGDERIFSQYPGMVWSRIIIALSLSKITVVGREHIPRDRYCVVTANHQSSFDIWALYGYMKIPFKWVLKGALSRVPFVGWACRRCGFIFVDNSTPERAASVVTESDRALESRYHIFIFPEGTRSEDGKLNKFKKGAFKIAMDTGAPVLPVSINGAYEIQRKGQFFFTPGHIRVVIHPPVESTDYQKDAKGLISLSGDVRQRIESGLDTHYLR